MGYLAAALLLLASVEASAQQQGESGFAYTGFSATTYGDSVFVFGGSMLGRGPRLQTGNFRIEPRTGFVERISADFIFGTGGAAAESAGVVFISGGSDTTYRSLPNNRYSSGFSDEFASYNIAENSWMQLPNLPFKVRGHCSFAFAGEVYVVGGEYEFRRGLRTRYALLGEVLRYSIVNRVWTAVPMPSEAPAAGAACAQTEDKVYVVGGARAGGLSSQVWAWDIGADTWRRLPDLPFPIGAAAAAAVGETVVLAGGYSYEGAANTRRMNEQIWALALGAQEWESIGQVQEGRTGHAVVVIAGSVWLLGGVDQQSLRPPAYSGALNGWWLEQPRLEPPVENRLQ